MCYRCNRGMVSIKIKKMLNLDSTQPFDHPNVVAGSEFYKRSTGAQQAQGPKTPRPITVHFKKRPSSSVLEVGMWYLL